MCVLVLSWEAFSGVRVLALPGDVSYALSHGVYLSDKQVLTFRCGFKLGSTRGRHGGAFDLSPRARSGTSSTRDGKTSLCQQ